MAQQHKTIKEILNSEVLNNDKYKYILISSIFNVNLKNAYEMIKFSKEHCIDEYINNRCLRRKVSIIKKVLDYLIRKNIDLIEQKNLVIFKLKVPLI